MKEQKLYIIGVLRRKAKTKGCKKRNKSRSTRLTNTFQEKRYISTFNN